MSDIEEMLQEDKENIARRDAASAKAGSDAGGDLLDISDFLQLSKEDVPKQLAKMSSTQVRSEMTWSFSVSIYVFNPSEQRYLRHSLA